MFGCKLVKVSDDAKKSPVEILSQWMDDPVVGRVSYSNLQEKRWKEMEHTGMVFIKNTLMLKTEREKVCLERK